MTTKILFITSNRLGDAVLSTGLYDYMAHHYPNAKISVACGPLAVSIFEGFPNLEKIYTLKKQKRSGHWIKLWQDVVLRRWDIVVDLRNSAVSRLVLAHKKYIYGPYIDKNMHKVEQNAAVLKLDQAPAPKLYHSASQREKASKVMGHYQNILAVGPAANWAGKTWPAERFIKLISQITHKDGLMPNAPVAVFAAPGEESMARPVLESVPQDRQIDIIAQGTPGDVAAMMEHCALYIGNDSGLMHTAAACGVPTFGLFGPSYPHLYRPWGKHASFIQTPESFDELIAYEGYTPQTAPCLMTSLMVEDVMAGVEKFWSETLKDS